MVNQNWNSSMSALIVLYLYHVNPFFSKYPKWMCFQKLKGRSLAFFPDPLIECFPPSWSRRLVSQPLISKTKKARNFILLHRQPLQSASLIQPTPNHTHTSKKKQESCSLPPSQSRAPLPAYPQHPSHIPSTLFFKILPTSPHLSSPSFLFYVYTSVFIF